jgi:hypothetical protein
MKEYTDNFENILTLNTIVEASIMQELLEEEGIPFYIRENKDIRIDGLCSDQKGYAALIAGIENAEKIKQLYSTISA